MKTPPFLASPPRREFLRLSALAAAAVCVARAVPFEAFAADAPSGSTAVRPDPDSVLRQLLEGNQRFAAGHPSNPRRGPEDFRAVAGGQNPVAAIVACSDSRVPPEILFDMGVGDLFVVRVAGNVINGAGPVVKGSIQYAVVELGVRLILVLGHTRCGAVKAAVEHIEHKDSLPGAINDLVELIKPAVTLAKTMPGDDIDEAIVENVKLGVERLSGLDPLIAPRVKDGRVKIAGGVYDLASGKVTLTH